MRAETIAASVEAWRKEPEKALLRPAVRARSDGAQAVLEVGPFSWRADLPQPLGGGNQAPGPAPYLLGALAGCAVVLIRDTLAPQLGVEVEAVEAVAECASDARGLLGMDGAVPDLRDLRLTIEIRSRAPEADVRRLYAAWQARCPIYLALLKPMPVATELRITSGA